MKLVFKFFMFLSLLYTVNCTLLTVGSVAEVGGMDIDVLSAKVGARPLGMGGAFCAIADNSDSPFYNPGGLSFVKQTEIESMQTRMSTDADHFYISYVMPFLKGAVGLSWIQVSLGDITQTTTTDAFNEVITTNVFSYFSNAYLLSYGLEVNPNVGLGVTAKYLTSDMTLVGGGTATGYSVTPGLMVKLGKEGEQFGAVGCTVDNILNEQKWGTGTTEKAIPTATLGLAVYALKFLPFGSTVAFDLMQKLSSDYAAVLSLGYEWKNPFLAMRFGWADSSLSAGAGFSAKTGKDFTTELNYAYVQQVNLSRDNVHRISLSGKW